MSSSTEKVDAPKTKGMAPHKTVTIDLRPALWSSKAVPDLPQVQNPYEHIGDAYERNQHTASKWEILDPLVTSY